MAPQRDSSRAGYWKSEFTESEDLKDGYRQLQASASSLRRLVGDLRRDVGDVRDTQKDKENKIKQLELQNKNLDEINKQLKAEIVDDGSCQIFGIIKDIKR